VLSFIKIRASTNGTSSLSDNAACNIELLSE